FRLALRGPPSGDCRSRVAPQSPAKRNGEEVRVTQQSHRLPRVVEAERESRGLIVDASTQRETRRLLLLQGQPGEVLVVVLGGVGRPRTAGGDAEAGAAKAHRSKLGTEAETGLVGVHLVEL